MATSENKKTCLDTGKIGLCHSAAVLKTQVPKLCTDLDLSLLYVLILGKYSKFARKVNFLALGVCFPQPCSSAGRRFAASRSRLQNYRRIFSFPTKNSMKCVVNWIPRRIRVRSRNTQPHLPKSLICWKADFHRNVKGGPESSNFEDLCLVNVSVKYFSKLCFGTSKIQLNCNIWKPFLKSSPFDFSRQRLGNTSLVVFLRFHFSLVVKWPELHWYILKIFCLSVISSQFNE